MYKAFLHTNKINYNNVEALRKHSSFYNRVGSQQYTFVAKLNYLKKNFARN